MFRKTATRVFNTPWPLLLMVFSSLCAGCDSPRTASDAVAEARTALQQSDWALALQHAKEVDSDAAEWNQSRLIAGEAATRLERYADAARFYRSVHLDGSDDAVEAQFALGEVLRELGRLTESIEAYRFVLADDAQNAATRGRLALLLSMTGQSWEAAPHFRFLVRSGSATLNELVLYADLERPIEEPDYLRSCLQQAPDDHMVQLGLAASAFRDGQIDEAFPGLKLVVAQHPSLLSAQAMLGEILLDRSADEFDVWQQQLPEAANQHPGIWYVRGVHERRQQRLSSAAWCFRRCLSLLPTHRRAAYQMSQLLAAMQHEQAAAAARISELQIQLSQALDDVLRSDARNPERVRRVVDLLARSGRVWETCAWALWAEESYQGVLWPRQYLDRMGGQLTEQLPQVLPENDLAMVLNAAAFEPYELTQESEQPGQRQAADVAAVNNIQFVADDAVLQFAYYNGDAPETPGVRMFEQTGGGVAILDLELDGRPDVFLSQGLQWPTGADKPDKTDFRTDALLRHTSETGFTNVSRLAELNDSGFGQGCTCADFDSDGFPDLYVANVGRNALYLNNGDGTFRDVTQSAGIGAADWTTSVLMADLNADGHPDVFDVGYLSGSDVYHRICQGRACSPSNFAGCRDRLLLSDGQGGLRDIADATPTSDSKGLGILTVFTDEAQRPDLFIANDQVANHLLRNTADGPDGVLLRENALISGVAFNEDGLSMACMGIAADDVNGDGRLDLFVTNFQDEMNTLYQQDASGLFIDWTRLSGLGAPSLPYVGWGTQFLDADLDGFSDLVVTNGHVDDYRDTGGMYQMRPQSFRGLGGSRFRKLAEATSPGFLDRPISGRGLARLDWNSDGRTDFVISCLLEPALLVTNQTLTVGGFLNVKLHGVQSARDAVGARVTVRAGDRRWTRYLLAGDGYMASNERLLQFGLGEAVSVDRVEVAWPTGRQSVVQDIPINATLILIEGRAFGALELTGGSESTPVSVGEHP